MCPLAGLFVLGGFVLGGISTLLALYAPIALRARGDRRQRSPRHLGKG